MEESLVSIWQNRSGFLEWEMTFPGLTAHMLHGATEHHHANTETETQDEAALCYLH